VYMLGTLLLSLCSHVGPSALCRICWVPVKWMCRFTGNTPPFLSIKPPFSLWLQVLGPILVAVVIFFESVEGHVIVFESCHTPHAESGRN